MTTRPTVASQDACRQPSWPEMTATGERGASAGRPWWDAGRVLGILALDDVLELVAEELADIGHLPKGESPHD